MGSLGPCPIYNYRIPPSTDFSEFVDIFYDGPAECNNQFLSEFDDTLGHYIFSGTPTREPTTPPPVPASSNDPMVSGGTYFILGGAENGVFDYYWPER
jgi:hypothetical protein